jgi:hypothetical protein
VPPWALISRDPSVRAAASAAIPGGAFPGVPATPPAGEAASGPEPASGGAGITRMSSRLTQTPRQSRTPQVSGRPPWEPAAEPNSELPWAQAPAPARSEAGPLPSHEQVRPQLPSWDQLAQEAWPGGPKLAGPHPPAASSAETNGPPGREGGRPAAGAPTGRVVPAAGLVPPRPETPEQPGRTENRPGYAWNTGAGVDPFRAAQSEPGTAPFGTGAFPADSGPPASAGPSGAGPSGVSLPGTGPAAVSQPGVSPARRPSLALPRRLGSSTARQADAAAAAGSGANPADGGLAGQGPAGGGLAGLGRTGGGLTGSGTTGSGATGAASAGPDWPGGGASQPPFPPAPRPATEPSLPDVGQPQRGPFPRAVKPPMDPAAAGTGVWDTGTIGVRPSGDSPPAPAFPQGARPAGGPGPAKGGPPPTGATLPSAARPGPAKPAAGKPSAERSGTANPGAGMPGVERSAPAKPGTGKPGTGKPGAEWSGTANPGAGKPGAEWSASAKPGTGNPGAESSEAGSTRPKTGVPPWEITDSFFAVPPAEASGTQVSGGPTAAGQPGKPLGVGMGGGGPADSTESFSAVDQRSYPRSIPGDSTESFPAMRPRDDFEDAFRLFPPVRGTDNRPTADGQDR